MIMVSLLSFFYPNPNHFQTFLLCLHGFVYKYSFHKILFTWFTSSLIPIYYCFFCKQNRFHFSKQSLVNGICKQDLKNFFIPLISLFLWFPEMAILRLGITSEIHSHLSLFSILFVSHT